MIKLILHGENSVRASFYEGCPREEMIEFAVKHFRLDKKEYKLVDGEEEGSLRLCKVKEK